MVLIANIPSSINKNILTLYHLDNSGKIISTIKILDGMILGHDISNSFDFQLSAFNKNKVYEKWSFSYAECMGACVVTHMVNNLSWANSICCFWH